LFAYLIKEDVQNVLIMLAIKPLVAGAIVGNPLSRPHNRLHSSYIMASD